MGTALVVVSGLGIFGSIGVLVISLLLKLVFLFAKKAEKKNSANKVAIISAIALGIFLITFIGTMIIAPKFDPVGWCSHEYHIIEQQDSTCTKSGYIKKLCNLCNNEITETIDAYHSWSEEIAGEATCATPKQIKMTCLRCGTTEYKQVGDSLNHSWVESSVIDATCATPKQVKMTCLRCGTTEYKQVGDSLNHSWVESSMIDATCLHPKQIINKCSICGTTETIDTGSTGPHTFGEWFISINPTVEKEGQQTRKCTVCQSVENATIPKISYIEVTANALWNAFNENEVAAEQKYNGKTVRITGVISEINSAEAFISANVLLTVDNSYFGCVQCNFDSKNAEALANLKKGESVIIEGTCGTVSLFNLMVRACKVIE